MRVRVYGTPVPQGSMKAFAVRKHGVPTGRVAVTADNTRTKPWRQAIVDAWRSALEDGRWEGPPVNGATIPLGVTITFGMPRPAKHYGTGRNRDQLRPGAPARPGGLPDIDKLCRAVLDALTAAGAWRDDAQVCELKASKRYADNELAGALIDVYPL